MFSDVRNKSKVRPLKFRSTRSNTYIQKKTINKGNYFLKMGIHVQNYFVKFYLYFEQIEN